MLLEDGISVNATVRDPSNIEKTDHLKSIAATSSQKQITMRSLHFILEDNSN
jgi:hypothetical protein